MREENPTARVLLALELIQNSPGITADRLAERLAVSERAIRRYVAVLREADVPIESERGRYGGYRVGRGLRIPPLMFTTTEALGLVMAVLEGGHAAADPADPVGSALGKIIRVLPEPAAGPAEAVRKVPARRRRPGATRPSPATTELLVQACASARRLRLGYAAGPGPERVMEVDPWAVVVHRRRWYLLCWSHTKNARRVLRVDRVVSADVLTDTFTPPADLDPVRTLEEHLSEGWKYRAEVVIDMPAEQAALWVPHGLGRLDELGPDRCRLTGTTNEPDWFAGQLLAIPAPFHFVDSPELQEAATVLSQRLLHAAGATPADR